MMPQDNRVMHHIQNEVKEFRYQLYATIKCEYFMTHRNLVANRRVVIVL